MDTNSALHHFNTYEAEKYNDEDAESVREFIRDEAENFVSLSELLIDWSFIFGPNA